MPPHLPPPAPATRAPQPALVEALLEAGANATIGHDSGFTPIHGVGFQGRHLLVPLLARTLGAGDGAAGADGGLSAFHEDGFAPLHRACWGAARRHADTVRAMLLAGVPGNLPSRAPAPASRGTTCWDMTTNPHTRGVLADLGWAPDPGAAASARAKVAAEL